MLSSAKTLRLILTATYVTLLLSGNALSQEFNRLSNTERTQQSQPVSNGGAVVAPRAAPISGRIVTESRMPLTDAFVNLSRIGPNKLTLTVATDKDGRFITDDLEPGAYLVIVSASGYVMPIQPSDSPQFNVYQPGDTVNITMVKGGVITGKVIDAHGEPMAALIMRAIRVRDLEGKPVRTFFASREFLTDDRGIYRLYGLEPGIYIIAAGGMGRYRRGTNPYEYDTPTYYPSGTRDNATEIRVDPGTEASSIDIRYRGDHGYVISGNVVGLPPGSFIWITLNHSGSNIPFITVPATISNKNYSFAIYGIPVGEYDLLALGSNSTSLTGAYASRHISVKDADVDGLNITLTSFSSITGKIIFEAAKEINQGCKTNLKGMPIGIPLKARRDEQEQSRIKQNSLLQDMGTALSSDSGEFVMSNLMGGLYRLEPQLPSEDLYVKSIIVSPNATDSTNKGSTDAARKPLTVKQGEQVKGVIITVINGAAGIQGHVITKGNLPASLHLHLIPVESEYADEILRYAETSIAADGSFHLKNLAPGRYWVVVWPSINETDSSFVRPVAWDNEGRSKLRAEAKAANLLLELKPCQQITEYVVPYIPSSPPISPSKIATGKSN